MEIRGKLVRAKIFFMMLMASSPSQSEVNIPNTFTSGSPAIASEVNDNFTALKDGVDKNESSIVGVKDDIEEIASEIGRWIVRTRDRKIGYMVDSRSTLATKQGYYFYVQNNFVVGSPYEALGMSAGGVFYITPNCDSDMYINATAAGGVFFANAIFRINGDDYYLDYENPPAYTGTVYAGSPGSCEEIAQNFDVWLAIPNDPVITGFDPTVAIDGPVYLEFGTLD